MAVTHLTLRAPMYPGTTTRTGPPWAPGSGWEFISQASNPDSFLPHSTRRRGTRLDQPHHEYLSHRSGDLVLFGGAARVQTIRSTRGLRAHGQLSSEREFR